MKVKKNTRQRSEQMQQVSAGLRDVLGMTQWRKEHPKAQAAVGARETDALPANQRRGSGEADPHLWSLPCVWGGLFSPWMSS